MDDPATCAFPRMRRREAEGSALESTPRPSFDERSALSSLPLSDRVDGSQGASEDGERTCEPPRKRKRRARCIFEPVKQPPQAWVRAAIDAGTTSSLPSEITVEEAREAWLAAERGPKPIHFSQGGHVSRRRAQRRRHQQAAVSHMVSLSIIKAPVRLPIKRGMRAADKSAYLSNAEALPFPGHRRDFGPFATPQEHDVIDCVSEFSGIGALEHGLQAGFEEAGLTLRVLQASERDDCSSGRHNASILRKRLGCEVLSPDERRAQPYPKSVRLVEVTTLCCNHSKLNPNRRPEVTEELLGPVADRLRAAKGVEIVIFENVPEFLQIIEDQGRSSYTYWVDMLEEKCGFTDHAYCLMPTWVCGDLHSRTRLLSVHSRGGNFCPVAAIVRHLVSLGEQIDCGDAGDVESRSACTPKAEVFAFSAGLSETRATTKGGVRPNYHRLPAYNACLNVIVFCQGRYWRVSPWLASKASALPDAWQEKERRPSLTSKMNVEMSALANMVSPLQARELGYAIAMEWQSKANQSDEQASWMASATTLPWQYKGQNPDEYPRALIHAGQKAAHICFRSRGQKWKRLADGYEWLVRKNTINLAELCNIAVKKGKMKICSNVTDLQRVVEDDSLSTYARACAEKQLRAMLRASLARADAGPRRDRNARITCLWVQCDECFFWRRLPAATACPEVDELFRCCDLPPPRNKCFISDQLEANEVETSRDELTFCEHSDSVLRAIALKVPAISAKGLLREICASDELAFDYWLKSRRSDHLMDRVKALQTATNIAVSASIENSSADGYTQRTQLALGDRCVFVANTSDAKFDAAVDALMATECDAAVHALLEMVRI
eukprot:scaffold157719_cov30-Tisochrysis_lutea.AAC.1